MRWLILIILLPLLLGGAQAAPGGCTVSGADVAASLAGATTCLDIPAGVYAVGPGTGGAWLNAPQDGLEIRGAGMGLTILRITSPLTLTSDMAALRLFGVAQRVHDLTIDLGGGHSGAGSLAGISVYGSGAQGAYVGRAERATIERVEVLGGYSATGAGGYGVGTYRAASDQGGAQYVTIRDCLIHDSPATAIGVNSSYNTIAHNTIARVGTNGLSHGIYAQGGYNLYEGNTIDRASGWSIHGYKQVPSIDASGDRYIGNTSTNPGSGHIVVNGTGGAPGTRYATISGNVLRNTAGRRTQYGIWCNGVPCLISANVLEDVFVTTGAGWIEDSGGSVIDGNLITMAGTPDGPINFAGVRAFGPGTTISDNVLSLATGAGVAVMAADAIVSGNQIRVSGNAIGMTLRGDGAIVQGNRITSTGSGAALIFTLSGPTNVLITGNYLRRAPALGQLFALNLAGVTGRISGNMFDGSYTFSNAAPGVVQ